VGGILRVWNWVEKFLVGLLALVATASAFYGVIMRYVFEAAPDWMEEIVIYMMIWAVFLMASTLAEEKGHVAATLIVERFSLRARRILAVFNATLALGFCLLISWYGFGIVYQAYIFDERSLTGLRFPLWVCYLSVAAGCTLVSIRYLLRVYRLLFRFDEAEIMETHEMSREERPS
jgi:C4-dicarboxylate transporter DctQ subunit